MNAQQNNNQEEIDFSFYFSAIFKHWALILFMLLLCIAGAVAANMLMQPRYKASVLMMIDEKKDGSVFSKDNDESTKKLMDSVKAIYARAMV